MVIIFLLFLLIFNRPVFADIPIVEITDYSSGTDETRPNEWVKLTNTTDEDINIENWSLRDKNDYTTNKDSLILTGCILKNSIQIFTHSKGWLNDEEDSIYLFDSSKKEIDNFSYTVKKIIDQPSNTNACIITSIPTIGTTNTDIATTTINIAVTESTIINPDSGISLSEFMPYKNLEWIEIFNDNNVGVKLDNWSIYDSDGKIFDINNLIIESKKYKIIEWSGYKLNDSGDSVSLYNNNNSIISQYSYPAGKYINDNISWSYINGSWCQAEMTKNNSNVSSCYQTSTQTPTITLTTTITPTSKITPTAIPTDRNLYELDESATASAVFTPTEESGFYNTPTISISPIISNLVLGETITAKKNYLPLVFIVSGGLLLISPLIFDKLKKK